MKSVSAAVRLNPRSAMRTAQHCFKRSELEPRGPRNGLQIGPRSSRGARSALLCAQTPKLQTRARKEGGLSSEFT
eukprot:14425104-Alexandrium_andersonii.AAC.1